MNAMLDSSSNPQTLRGYYDQLLAASSTDYMAANQSYPKTRDVTSQILDPEMRATLIEMFTLRLQDEMRSTGTCPTGQAHCSEMQKFRAILAQLKE